MLRKLHHIPLSELAISKLNVRRHGAKEIDSLAASIGALGIIQPLLVRKDGDGYEIVAGRRRYLAAKKLDGDGVTDIDKVPCVLLEADDDATAIEASLAENVERLPMDDLEQYEAFAALRRKGLGEADIATHFGISEQIVKRRLAIANLHPDIRRLYRAGDIDTQTLQLLTLATKERQKAWLALNNDPHQEPPPAWQLKAWLLGGAEISTTAALFDEAIYQGGIAADLFGEQRYFTDPDEFWRLQNAAIAERREQLLKSGWAEVHIIEPDRRFQPWDYESASKAEGGGVYIVVEPDGHVTMHKGLKPRRETRRSNRKASNDESADASVAAERPEMSAPLASYVDLVRHSAVRLAVADAPDVALRLMLAHVIGGGRRWKVEPETQRPETPAVGEALAALPSQSAFARKRAKAAKLLRDDMDAAALVAHDGSGARTAAMFARLLDMTDAQIMQVLAVVMAETLAAGTDLIDTLGARLGVDCLRHWQPDNTFFGLVKDREAVSGMLAEVIGETAAATYLTDTGTKKKMIIGKALAGDGRSKVETWTPRYMTFPQRGYTGRAVAAAERPGA
ncbi:MAG: ParB/RepB/Spo0J family partition protein [Hyphomonadaceae bacterium]|jgi:ParB family chromosome partitioning protein|nr:ParB/RepB/Spo0J family partition protein [Hyphomonadaceae bacterium]